MVFGFFKKELYINRLVKTYNHHYGIGETKSINVLRKNYSKDELSKILKEYKNVEKQGMDPFKINLFKENGLYDFS